ncbi:MAG: hypothetical protein ABL974_20530 [Prosthecobacter sp.]
MPETLFLYLDFLGFRALSASPAKVRRLFQTLDGCAIHRDSNFRTVVFSDTLLAYNSVNPIGEGYMWTELMYLIEFVQDITHRLTGSGISFRALIRFGEFEYSRLQHVESYFGEALIASYDDESKLPATGLFLHKSVIPYNNIFQSAQFSDDYHYSFLAYDLTRLARDDFDYPVSPEVTMWSEAGIEERVLFQIQHLREIYDGTMHSNPLIRSKYLGSWSMYQRTYPRLVEVLVGSSFDPASLCELDWSSASESLRVQTSSFESP